MKRVALYYPWIYVRSGVERTILELVRRSRHQYTVFTNHYDAGQTFPQFRVLERLVVGRKVPVERSFRAVLQAASIVALQKLPLERFDALLVSSEGIGDFVTFRNASRPVFCFCHTPVRPVYDSVYRRVWLKRHPGGRLPLAIFSILYRAITRWAWRHYARVFVNSEEVRARVLAGELCTADRIEVLHPGVDLPHIVAPDIGDPYFLYSGRIKWTKNVELAVRAFLEFRRRVDSAHRWRLVVAGGVDAGSRDYLAQLRKISDGDSAVSYHPDPSDEELADLYFRCYAVVFPSLNEDWGIVPLEAMAHSKPVLAVNRGGPTESIVHGETGFLLEPTPEAFAGQMLWLSQHPEVLRRMGVAARARATAFSWDAFVRRLDDYVETLA
jgi:glycosyltransferase involved in cell wall biosynthesis